LKQSRTFLSSTADSRLLCANRKPQTRGAYEQEKTPAAWSRALKTKFLQQAFAHCPEAYDLLAGEVREGRMSVASWAACFHVQGSWVEKWAEDVMWTWRWTPGVYPMWPPPPLSTEADRFTVTLTAVPRSHLELGVLRGGCLPSGPARDDITHFRELLHQEVDDHIDAYLDRSEDSGATRRAPIPSELDLKLAAAAVYVFCGLTCQQIGKLRAVARDQSVVNRWLNEVFRLLELRMREGFSCTPESVARKRADGKRKFSGRKFSV
jgi:hypothetical protein